MLVEDCFDNLLDSSDENELESDVSLTKITSVTHGISILADLNETAIQYIQRK